jgi:putative tricarboxylic transport membrane protein
MRTPDRWSGFFGLAFSILVCIEAYRLDIGSYRNPGSGFFPFWVGIVLGILSFLFLIQKFLKREKKEEMAFQKVDWRKILLVIASLYVYALVLEKIGFILSTFLLVAVLLKFVDNKKWYILIFVGGSSALACYLVFELWLQSHLPKGIFWF